MCGWAVCSCATAVMNRRTVSSSNGSSARRPAASVSNSCMEHHVRRLGIGGTEPAMTALLLVQAVEVQVHTAALNLPGTEPPATAYEPSSTSGYTRSPRRPPVPNCTPREPTHRPVNVDDGLPAMGP